jgi:outer membrane protein TolC
MTDSAIPKLGFRANFRVLKGRTLAMGLALVVLSGAAGASAAPPASARTMTLSQAITIAKQKSPAIIAAREGAEVADAAADEARAGWLPSARLNASGSLHDVAPPSAGSTSAFQRVTLDARLAWTAWDFGRTWNNIEAASARATAAEERRRGQTLVAIREVVTAYFTVLLREEELETNKLTERSRQRQYAIAKELTARGLRPDIEELRARIAAESAKIDVQSAAGNLVVAKATLNAVLALEPQEELKLTKPTLPTFTESTEKVVQSAEKNRPEFAENRARVEAADASEKAARAEFFPSIGVSADLLLSGTKEANFIGRREVVAQITLSVPIFDYGVISRNRLGSHFASEQRAQLDGQRRTLQADSIQIATRFQVAKQNLQLAEKVSKASTAALAIMEARYQAGSSSALELFDTQEKEANARVNKVRSELGLAEATALLLAITGRMNLLDER